MLQVADPLATVFAPDAMGSGLSIHLVHVYKTNSPTAQDMVDSGVVVHSILIASHTPDLCVARHGFLCSIGEKYKHVYH